MKSLVLFLNFFVMIPSLYCISMPSVFSDHMVLQRNSQVRIWGWGKPQEKVILRPSWSNRLYETTIEPHGSWELLVGTAEAGGPYEIEVSGYNTIVFTDVMIGEVWFCAGQSNMEWTARMGIQDATKEVQQAHYPDIRFFRVPHRTATTPQDDMHAGQWVHCSPSTMIDFSAVAYYFARELQGKLNIPVGLIDVSWGGTPIEAWIASEQVEDKSRLKESASVLDPVPWGPVDISVIYNAMVAPLTKFNIDGWLWYQGEANVINPEYYEEMMHLLVNSWRKAWGLTQPFYYVQIAPHTYGDHDLGVKIRDAQRRSMDIPHTGMVITSDIGDTLDIHPLNKRDVGLRLARLSLLDRGLYDKEVYGPLYDHYEVRDDVMRIFFTHAEGLTTNGSPLSEFEVAGDDGVFYHADAHILDNTVVLQSAHVPNPVAARFAWTNTATPNLVNDAGLPASCFHTEDWRRPNQ